MEVQQKKTPQIPRTSALHNPQRRWLVLMLLEVETFPLYNHSTGKAIPLISLLNIDVAVKSYPTLSDPTHCSPPGSCIHGILQAWRLEWIAISSSRVSSQPRDPTMQGSCIAGGFFTIWATREAPSVWKWTIITQISLCELNLEKLGLWWAGGPGNVQSPQGTGNHTSGARQVFSKLWHPGWGIMDFQSDGRGLRVQVWTWATPSLSLSLPFSVSITRGDATTLEFIRILTHAYPAKVFTCIRVCVLVFKDTHMHTTLWLIGVAQSMATLCFSPHGSITGACFKCTWKWKHCWL